MYKKLITVVCILFGLTLFAAAADMPDNSEKNKTQIENRELDARDQSNAKADVELTAQIRKGVMAQKSFSTNAKNVKIITAAGQVTLKGPVNSLEEKNTIHSIATKFAGATNVNNEIEITTK